MSDLTPHSRDDLDFLPCDCELPALTPTHGPSFYLTLPPRTLSQAVKDISRYRDLPTWVYELLPRFHRPLIDMTPFRPATACVVSLAAERARRVR
jgi:hypothetical protein